MKKQIMNNIQKIFIGFLILAIGILAGIAYFQDLSLNNLQQQVTEIREIALKMRPENNSAILENQDTQSQSGIFSKSLKASIPSINFIVGEVKEILIDSLTIDAKIPDISKLDQYDESKNESYPRIVKTYKVKANKDTLFFTKQLNELKRGDWVSAYSSNPIYQSTEFEAMSISYFSEEDAKALK